MIPATAADVVVLPSHQEGLPVVLMEAFSLGATVVATTVGGVPLVVDDGVNGLLVPAGRADLLGTTQAPLGALQLPGLRFLRQMIGHGAPLPLALRAGAAPRGWCRGHGCRLHS